MLAISAIHDSQHAGHITSQEQHILMNKQNKSETILKGFLDLSWLSCEIAHEAAFWF